MSGTATAGCWFLYFDLTAMPPPDQMRAYSGARKFIDEQMKPPDLHRDHDVRGRRRAREAGLHRRPGARCARSIETLIYGEDQDGDGCPTTTDIGTAFGQDDAEFNILNTDRQLSALQTAATMLQALPEQKSLVYFASGLRLNGVDNQAQLRATVNAAIRANVSIYPVDARGLVAEAPLGDATRPSPGGIGMFTGQLGEHAMTGFQRSQDTLYASRKTPAARRSSTTTICRSGSCRRRRRRSYYIIGFYSTHTANDGKFHRVKVALTAEPSATSRTARAISPTRSSRSSPRRTRSASSRRR